MNLPFSIDEALKSLTEIKQYCEANPECEGCPFMARDSDACVMDLPLNWNLDKAKANQ